MNTQNENVLVFGVSGLLGSMVYRVLSEGEDLKVFGTIRSSHDARYFSHELRVGLVVVNDLTLSNELEGLIEFIKPGILINCLSIRKPFPEKIDYLLPLLSLLPRRLNNLCEKFGIRLIQISSDGVFSGARGLYAEDDIPDASDSYGISKFLGETSGTSLVLRTSIIGPEMTAKSGLLEWFLSQSGSCTAYSKSIFSPLSSYELAKLIKWIILSHGSLSGLFHVASTPLSKYELLESIAREYRVGVELVPDNRIILDRSLKATKLKNITGYFPPSWVEMLYEMRRYQFGLRKD